MVTLGGFNASVADTYLAHDIFLLEILGFDYYQHDALIIHASILGSSHIPIVTASLPRVGAAVEESMLFDKVKKRE